MKRVKISSPKYYHMYLFLKGLPQRSIDIIVQKQMPFIAVLIKIMMTLVKPKQCQKKA